MDTKEYLEQVKRIDEEIRFREDEIKALQQRADRITAVRCRMTKVKTESVDNRLDVVCEMLDRYIAEHREAVCRLNETIIEISKEIVKLEDLDEVMCLTYRYVRLLSWNEVADAMGFSVRHLRRIRDRGVAHLDELRRESGTPD